LLHHKICATRTITQYKYSLSVKPATDAEMMEDEDGMASSHVLELDKAS